MQITSRRYFIGVGWFILSLISSVINDTITKYLGNNLPSFEVAFFRFLFSALTLIPFICYQGLNSIKSSRPGVHFIRGGILFCGMVAWTYGLKLVPITTATIISFTIPLFTLILAKFFLDENIIWQRWLATIVGFVGTAVVLGKSNEGFSGAALIFVLAAIGFASLDIINKKFIIQETMISMLFYSAIVAALLAAIPAFFYWQSPTTYELGLLFILGTSANLILFLILKAFSLIDATAIAPYRYLELVMSAAIGYVLFNEVPTINTLYGTLIIIPSTLFIVYSENKSIKNK